MATPIETLISALQPTGYPTVGRLPTNITGVTLLVGIDSIAPGGVARMRRWTMAVTVLSPLKDPESADLELERAVTEVLDALDKAQPLNWTGVESGVIGEAYNGLKVSVFVLTQEATP